jgi:hypothetical protein
MSRIAPEWVIVAGGFHDRGAMDRANAALAAHLLRQGARVHLVGHEIDDRFRHDGGARCYEVPRPPSAAPLAESLLSRRGLSVALRVTAACPEARVVVNGGNCPWPDINWVHAVHAAWPVYDEGAPAWVKVKHRAVKALARRQERGALRIARVVIANSRATARTIIAAGLASAAAVRTVYLGSDPSWAPPSADERAAARAAFRLDRADRVVAFVGTLGFDLNKGFDLVWNAWTRLTGEGGWNARLLVAGGGGRLPFWRREAERVDAGKSIQFLGHTLRVREVLASADLLVSPVRYEAYGLNVQEALCRGAGVMVTANAGIVERFAGDLRETVLPPAVTSDALAAMLRAWVHDVDGWKARAASTAASLQSRSWDDMASEIVAYAGDETRNPEPVKQP